MGKVIVHELKKFALIAAPMILILGAFLLLMIGAETTSLTSLLIDVFLACEAMCFLISYHFRIEETSIKLRRLILGRHIAVTITSTAVTLVAASISLLIFSDQSFDFLVFLAMTLFFSALIIGVIQIPRSRFFHLVVLSTVLFVAFFFYNEKYFIVIRDNGWTWPLVIVAALVFAIAFIFSLRTRSPLPATAKEDKVNDNDE